MQTQSPVEKFALHMTQKIGSLGSLILHTIFFILCFVAVWFHLIPLDTMLLVLTTIVSLEAIYLALFIQMTVNMTTRSLAEVSEDIDEIQEDVEEMSEDVEEIQKDIDEIQEDVEEMQEDVEEMSEDVEEMQEDVDEIQEDVEEISESDKKPAPLHAQQSDVLAAIHADLKRLMQDIDALKRD